MNNFARNLNDNFRQNTTRYKEVRNIGNKEKIEDRFGLSNAYASKSGLYSTGKTLYIYIYTVYIRHYRQRWKYDKGHN